MTSITQPRAPEAPPTGEPTPDAVSPPPGHPRFPHVDALRAVAALAVLAAHAGNNSGALRTQWYGPVLAQGVGGVTLFFVISGFLLYRPFLAADLDGRRPVRWLDYGRRRVLRILPAYWLALTIIAYWEHLPGVLGPAWWRFYFLLQVYNPITAIGGLVVAWTLCVEASFYLYLPFHAAAMSRLSRGRSRAMRLRLEFWVLAVLGAASLVVRYEAQTKPGLQTIYLTLLTTFAWFALGMALAVISVSGAVPRLVGWVTRHPGRCWLFAGVLYLVLSELERFPPNGALTSNDLMFQYVVTGIVAVALMAPAVFGNTEGGLPRRVMSWRWLGALGLISYGIYLWGLTWADHAEGWWVNLSLPGWLPAFVFVFGAAFVASVLCAAASYYGLERPLMRFKNRGRAG